MSDTDLGTLEARLVNGEVVVDRADDLIQVAGELAEQYGVKPPLPGRIEFAPGYVYDLSAWIGGVVAGRQLGTYLGRRVITSAETT